MKTRTMTDNVVEMLTDVASTKDKVEAISNTVKYMLNAMADDAGHPEIEYGYTEMEYTLVKLYAAAIQWPARIATQEDQENRIDRLVSKAIKDIVSSYAKYMELSREVITARLKQVERHPSDTKGALSFMTDCLYWLEKEPDTPEKQAVRENIDFAAMLNLLM